MLANDLKKGAVVRLTGTGWRATIMDNKKGLIRMAQVKQDARIKAMGF